MQSTNFLIKDFNYHLPDENIAKYPLKQRDESKLLVYRNGEISEDTYQHLSNHLPEDTLLVFNNTKVVEARILFRKPTGGIIEIFCLEPHTTTDISNAMLETGSTQWRCLVGGASKWKHGQVLQKVLGDHEFALQATIVSRLSDCFVIEFSWHPQNLAFAEVLHRAGVIPLPPYLHREAEKIDNETYQTVYAKNDGSVAAPTAGLHFTENLLQTLKAKGVEKTFVTLHVGAGTFKPVKSENVADHTMHAEFIDVSISNIKKLQASINKTTIAVGTTSLRTIETIYWIGVKLEHDPNLNLENYTLPQWAPYEEALKNVEAFAALENVIRYMHNRQIERLIASTQIIIMPGYRLRLAKAIITNFHQPQSTLLLLIAAIVGDDWKKIYGYALANNFRFLSYGDGSLLWPKF